MSANQSRRRIDPEPSSASSTRSRIDNGLPYQGRELNNVSIRLVEIQPATQVDDPMVCTLREATFGSRPKFEALSYIWGDDRAHDTITLNGYPFEVRSNLRDALLFLRRQYASGMTTQSFWIDAICINQSNIEERNRQLRIMDQIYSRASTVVVWLGSSYTELQREFVGVKPEDSDDRTEEPLQIDNSAQKNMVRRQCVDPYWERLWILQEIGRARQLRVCFGQQSFTWDNYMHLITMHNSDGSTGPLRLNRLLRQEKYNDAHTLKRLLEEHREAKCSEPRDKIYGLIGLASDAAQFPMDYSKSLYDVWTDTMVFMNKRKLFTDESQILPIGGLVKSILMGIHSDPLSQIAGQHQDQADPTQVLEDPDSPLVFCFGAVAVGFVVHVGPTVSDVVSNPTVASEWRFATQLQFPGNELGQAHHEHDILLYTLIESDESEIEGKCFNRPSTILWKDFAYTSGYPDRVKHYADQAQSAASQLRQPPTETTNKSASVQPRLYLAKGFGSTTRRRMGIASSLVQLGDLVCCARSSRKAILVRIVQNDFFGAKLRAFGTAVTTEDLSRSALDYNDSDRWNSLSKESKMEVKVDASTIFTLLD
ncbi:heterokaryon incompatibility protein-domain-containing protein [Xylariales sp. PMI_506]|nr:heterokaryon incompatibility protein-domain-containing protein [Xylariales sp. PMI_506]